MHSLGENGEHAQPTSFDYFTDRYYHHYLVPNCKGVEDNNCRLLLHSNGLCILCLDESHAAVRSSRENPDAAIESVVFGSGRGNSKMDPSSINVLGKRKKNATVCQSDTKVCVIKMMDGKIYNIPACLDGFILELNSEIQSRPSLLSGAPTAEGFIGIISPNYSRVDFSKFVKLSTASDREVAEDGEEEP